MLSDTKKQLKTVFFFTVIPMLIFDILFFVVYNLCNKWTTHEYLVLTKEQITTLPALLIPPDMPHRMFITPILTLVISATLICYFTTLKSYKSSVNMSCIQQIKTIVVAKVVSVVCMFYFMWYAIIEQLYTVDRLGDAFYLLEDLFKIYSPIIMLVSYALIAFAVFKCKEEK